MCFLLQKELERTHFLWNWCWAVEERSNACMFFPFCKLSSQAEEAAKRQTLSPALLPTLSLPLGCLNCGLGLVATAGENRKPQLCGTKQACIMFTQ